MRGIEPGAPATRSPTDAYWRCAAPTRTGRFTRHGTGPAWPGKWAASARSRSAGAAKGISTCGSLACAIRLRRSMWLALQLWNGGARRDAASVGGSRSSTSRRSLACRGREWRRTHVDGADRLSVRVAHFGGPAIGGELQAQQRVTFAPAPVDCTGADLRAVLYRVRKERLFRDEE